MSRSALSLLISLPLGLLIPACGDDGGGGAGGETDTDPTTGTSMTDATMTASSMTSPTTTTDPSTTTGPTSTTEDPSTGEGNDSSSSGTPDTDSEDTDDTTGTVEPVEIYFRVNSIGVADPHLFLEPFPGDITTIVNDQLTTALSSDSPDDETMQDGLFDLGFAMGFRPLDQSDGGTGPMFFANAACTAPAESTTCDALADSVPFESTYTTSVAGPCYEPTEGNLSQYGMPPEGPTATDGPCFSAQFDSVGILAGDFILPMTDVTLSATYVGVPAGNLIGGNIEGFISQAAAEATTVPVPGGDRQLSELLMPEDGDPMGDGWIFHLNFTALPVDWTGE